MPSALVILLALVLVAIHLRAPFRVSAAALVMTTFVVPGGLAIPEGPPTMVIVRIGLWAAVVGVVVRSIRGELPGWSIRPTRVLVALSGFVVIAYVVGVARAPVPSTPHGGFDFWLMILDQLLFLWVATIAVRLLGVRAVATYAVVAVVASAAIAVGEKFTGTSYARFWFEHQPTRAISALPLELRGNDKRVRGAADFALEYAWVLAYFMPLVALWALRAKRMVALVAPALVSVALVFTITRSAYAGLGIGAVMMLLSARGDKRILFCLGAAGLVVLTLYFGTNAVRQPYQSADPESERVRARRLVLVTQELAPDPWLGVGLDGLIHRGIKGTDNAALATYATVGVVGLTALVGALGSALITAAYPALFGDDELAPIAGAVAGGLGAAVVGMFAFDTFSAPISSWNLWLLAALGVGLFEEVRVRKRADAPRPVELNRGRLLLPAAGMVGGIVLATFVPSHVALEMRVFTLSSQYLSVSKKPNDDYIGRILVESVCDLGSRAVASGTKVDCFDPLNRGPGTGIVRLESSTRPALRTAAVTFAAAAAHLPTARFTVTQTAQEGTPTWARTAPVTGLLAGAEAAVLLPVFRLRRRRAATSR